MTNVFIAPKIRIGFQKRDDCFTGKLAYIIYYDDKGKIRKEKSWQSWRDKKIDPEEFENTPMDGFTLNKDIKRYSGEWFSSHRTMIRVHDPRGFEFEVTTENLIAILMHTDCLRRGLVGQFVYAWVGTELILLPTNSEEYQSAIKYTANLSKKVKAKDLVPGVSYNTKREGDVIFIGKLNWYEYVAKSRYANRTGSRLENKVLVFTNDDGKTFFKKPSVDFLSEANSDQAVSNYAELVEKFNKKSYANKIARYDFRPTDFDPETISQQREWYGPRLRRQQYFVESNIPGIFYDVTIEIKSDRKMKPDQSGYSDEYVVKGYVFDCRYGGGSGIRQTNGEIMEIPAESTSSTARWGYLYSRDYYNRSIYNLDQMSKKKFYDFYIVFENGKEKKINSLYELTSES